MKHFLLLCLLSGTLQPVLAYSFSGTGSPVHGERVTIPAAGNDSYPSTVTYKPLMNRQTQSKPQPAIKGTVTDSTGRALSGVSIQITGTSRGTVSDAQGNFSIQANPEDTLIFSYIGYRSLSTQAGNRSDLQIVLHENQTGLGEVVVVGYGTQKKSSLTAAISTVDGDAVAEKPVADLSNNLGGRVPGLIFTQGSGEPGADGSNLLIRGIGTTGSTAPLVIVDGVPRNFTRLDPHSIASITVLKDAAAVAPYGMAGANGVILVTTKAGKKGAPTLSYDGYVGWQNPTVLTEFANAYQFARLFNEADDNEGAPHRYSDYDLQKYKDGSDPIGHPNHDVLDELLNANTLITNHNLQLSGGSDKLTYYVGMNYLYQAGMWGPTNLHQYNLSAKIQADVTPTTRFALSINDRVEQNNYPGVATTGAGNIFSQAFRTPPNVPLAFEGGKPAEYQGRSVYGQIHNSGYNRYRNYVLYNQLSIEQQLPFLPGLRVKGVFAYDLTPTFKKIWATPIPYYTADTSQHPPVISQSGKDGPAKPTYQEIYAEAQAFTYQGYINYQQTFGKHAVSALVVLEARTVKSSNFSANRVNYNVDIPELDNGSSDPADINNSGNSSESRQRSIVYRLTYNYAGKYLFEASGRYDGNYYFAPGHRYGFFPSFSAGWLLSEESFIKDHSPWMNSLKLRASYGESGALAGDPFQYLSSYNLYGNSAVLGGSPTQGLYESTEPNTRITWERAKKYDAGLEVALWDGWLNFSGDYFYEKRNNMLISPNVTVPAEYGIGLAQVNAGVMHNQGFEFSIGTAHQFAGGLYAALTANFTYAKNELVQTFETDATYNNPHRRRTGRALGTKFGYKALGYFQTTDDTNGDGVIAPDEYPVTQPWGTVHPGDLKYQDTNGDGTIDINDEVPIGYPDIPEIIYGIRPELRFKGFDLSLLFQGAAHRSFYIADVAAWPFTNAASVPITALDVWRPDNPHAANPRVTTIPATNNVQYSSWWLHDAGYLRLKTGTLGYTLPKSALRYLSLQAVRVYVSGQNILTWSPLKNFDPEISNGFGQFYPQQKVLSVGLSVTF